MSSWRSSGGGGGGGRSGRDGGGSSRHTSGGGGGGGRSERQPSRNRGGPGGASSSNAPPSKNAPLVVDGVTSGTIATIIQGTFTVFSENHGKPVYKKDPKSGSKSNSDVTVLIYFWDQRDGPRFSGWWFGPKVGGDQVWAYTPHDEPVPPKTGWRIPWDGDVDGSMRVSASSSSSSAIGRGSAIGGGGDGRAHAREDTRPTTSGRDDTRRRDDDHRRRDRSGRREDGKRREEDDRRKRREEEDRRRREKEREEAKRRDEERRRREEEDRRRRDEERRKADEKRKREEEAKRRETAAVLDVRRVMQAVRIATPDTFNNVRTELESAIKNNYTAMGSQAANLKQEAEDILKDTERRVQEAEKRRREEEKRREEELATLAELLAQGRKANAEFEALLMKAQEAVKDFPPTSIEDLEPSALLEQTSAATKAVEEAKSSIDKAKSWMAEHHKDLTANRAERQTQVDWHALQTGFDTGKANLAKLLEKVDKTKTLAEGKKQAMDQEKERRERFENFDSDQDGVLSCDDIVKFGKSIHRLEAPEEVFAKIYAALKPVTYDKFRALHRKLAVAKWEKIARERRAEEERIKKEQAERRAKAQEILDASIALLAAAEDKLGVCEGDARDLTRDLEKTADTMKAVAAKVKEVSQVIAKEAADAGEKVKELKAQCVGHSELLDYEEKDAPRMEKRVERISVRLGSLEATLKAAMQRAASKAHQEVDEHLTHFVAALHKHIGDSDVSRESVFDKYAAGSEDLTLEGFTKLCEGLDDLPSDAKKLSELMTYMTSSTEESELVLTKERFLQTSTLYYKCVRSTVCSEDITIKSKTVRRLEPGDIVQAIGGARTEEGANVRRVNCQLVGDTSVSGWITIQGNQGTPFLVPDGNFFNHGEKKKKKNEEEEEAEGSNNKTKEEEEEQQEEEEEVEVAKEEVKEEKKDEEEGSKEDSQQKEKDNEKAPDSSDAQKNPKPAEDEGKSIDKSAAEDAAGGEGAVEGNAAAEDGAPAAKEGETKAA